MLRVIHTDVEKLDTLYRSSSLPYKRLFDTPLGTLLLQDECTPSLVEKLYADDGLVAFARLPEREHELLLTIANRPDSILTLAYTATGKIVGQATLAPADSWWGEHEPIYEIAIEVSSPWRECGVAQQLLSLALQRAIVEHVIIIGMGLSWHWDIAGLGLSTPRYALLIAQLFSHYGFMEYITNEPNISMDPANMLLVRIGNCVEQETRQRFLGRLFQST